MCIPKIDRRKYIVPSDMTAAQFVYVIRKRLRFRPTEALFLFVGSSGTILSGEVALSSLCDRHVDEDGFLYVKYDIENTFG